MRQYFILGLGMAAGAAIGAGAVTALHAQAKPPAYFVVEIDKVNDAEGFKVITQRPRGGADVAKELGGHYIARTDGYETLRRSAIEGGYFLFRQKQTFDRLFDHLVGGY